MGLQRKGDDVLECIPQLRYSPPPSAHSTPSSSCNSSSYRRSFPSSQSSSSTLDTFYVRSSEGEGSSEELSESPKNLSSQSETRPRSCKPRPPGIASYIPHDLPKSFELPNNFGKKVNKALSESKAYGSMPQDAMKVFIRQLTEHLEAENPHPCIKTIEWVAWKCCSLYPGLKQANPLETLKMPDEWNGASSAFKEWVGDMPLIIYRYDTIECFHSNRLVIVFN